MIRLAVLLRGRGPAALLAAAYAGFIFFLSAQTGLPGFVSLVPDYAGHAMLYTGLGFLLANALTNRGALTKMTRGAMAAGLASLYGVSDEWHQSFVPGRTPEVSDWAADTFGAAAGVAVFLFLLGHFGEPGSNSRG